MTVRSLFSIAVRTLVVFAAVALASRAFAAPLRLQGVYTLKEWHLGDEIVRPPRVDGRFLLVDGVAITILHDRSVETDLFTVIFYGSYTLSANNFAYSYQDASVIVQGPSSTSITREVPWEGIRNFVVRKEAGGVVRFRGERGKYEFLFSPDGRTLTYSEYGKIKRVWQRVGPAK